jgi:hypothetical protein
VWPAVNYNLLALGERGDVPRRTAMSDVPVDAADPALAPEAVVVGSSGEVQVERAASAATGRQTPAKRRAGSAGGKRARAVALIGIEGAPATIDLRSSDARMAVIEAVLSAVVRGKTSALAATTALAAIKEARSEANDQWERVAHKQAQIIEELRGGRTIG